MKKVFKKICPSYSLFTYTTEKKNTLIKIYIVYLESIKELFLNDNVFKMYVMQLMFFNMCCLP